MLPLLKCQITPLEVITHGLRTTGLHQALVLPLLWGDGEHKTHALRVLEGPL